VAACVTDRFSQGWKNPGRPTQLDLMVEFEKTKMANLFTSSELSLLFPHLFLVKFVNLIGRVQIEYPISLDSKTGFETKQSVK
jgi:hypothetical protein